MGVQCANCQHLLTNGHEKGLGSCWKLPDKGMVYTDVGRDCKDHLLVGLKKPSKAIKIVR